jgi:putative ABC transport system permease protein
MLSNYIKIAWRNLWKHKFYTSINVFGLALSISCSIILFLFITYHLSFDTYHPNAKNIYRVVNSITFDDGVAHYDPGAPLVLAQELKATNPKIKEASLIYGMTDVNVSIPQNDLIAKKKFTEHDNVGITDGRFFNMFGYDWEQGDKDSALSQPNEVVLSHSFAQKYFGSQNVIGKSLVINNKTIFTVAGVVKDHPANTDIKSDVFLSFASVNTIYPEIANKMLYDWTFINSTGLVFIALQDGVNAKDVEGDIAQMKAKAIAGDIQKAFGFILLPLREVHFDGRFTGVIQRSLLTTLGIVGLLLIIIACVNFINMATAQSFKRAKEIGTRKVLGSSPKAIFIQFICETAYIVIFAVLLSFAIVAFVAPVLNSWLQTQLNFNFTDYRLGIFVGLTLTIIIAAAGSYPALILSRFKPINALKNQISGHAQSGAFTRKGLIVVQNVIAQVLIVSTILITLQVRYLKTADLGFDTTATIMLRVPDNAKGKTDFLRNQLLADPAVKNVSFCHRAPSSTSDRGGSIKYDTRNWEKFGGYEVTGDANYVKTFGLQLIAGRNIRESDEAREYLVNETMVRTLNLKDPQQVLGKKFTAGNLSDDPGIIVGVIKDFHAKSLYVPIGPEYIAPFRKGYEYAGVRIGPGNPSSAIQRIKKTWEAVYPDHVFEYRFLDEQLADFYQKEDLMNKLITTSAIVAIAISCLGILGLISLIAVQRTKEIGIRKVLGASVAGITAMLSKDFIKLILIAVVIASPIAWWAMTKWLRGFAYRIDMQWWHFAIAGAAAIFIAFATLCIQSVKAAMANPVKSLRNE